MFDDIRPIRTLEDHDRAMAEVERLWGSPDGTPDGDRLEVLAELIQAFEKRHYKRGPPDPI